MNEVLSLYRETIEGIRRCGEAGSDHRPVLPRLSAHREENVDRPERLRLLLSSLNAVAEEWGWPVLVLLRAHATGWGPGNLTTEKAPCDAPMTHPLVRFHPPFGFLDYNRLQLSAACVLSDSRTISEESTIVGFPAVTLRSSIERPEALDTGAITMTDLDPAMVVAGVRFAIARGPAPELPVDYAVTNTSERVVNFILSTAGQHRFWAGSARSSARVLMRITMSCVTASRRLHLTQFSPRHLRPSVGGDLQSTE